MSKIQVTLDASKLRGLVTKRSYKNNEGNNVEVDEVKFELVELKEPKQIFAKDNLTIMKTHFACVIQNKEERDAKAPTVYIGEGFTATFEDAKANPGTTKAKAKVEEQFSDIPF